MDLVTGQAAGSGHTMFRKVPVLTDALAVTGQAVTFYLLDAGFRVVKDVSLVQRLHVVSAGTMTRFTSWNSSTQLK